MPTDLIAVFDVETTGFSPWRNDRVVEIAIVLIHADGSVHLEYDTLVNPNRDIGPSCIHQISSGDVLQAPKFSDIAGDVLEILAGANVVAGHNVSFDKNFLIKEYNRIGITFPDIPMLCTCSMFGRNNLSACCREVGIEIDGIPHRALSDARATSRLVSVICSDDSTVIENFRIRDAKWPALRALRTPCYRREHAQKSSDQPPNFLQRIAAKIHHDLETQTPNVLAYLTLIDRILEDRKIDQSEEEALVDAALNWELSPVKLDVIHAQYLYNLAVSALSDGIVSESERRDLHLVSKLLGQDDSGLDSVLETAARQLAVLQAIPKSNKGDLQGKSVCFTGQMQATIGQEPIKRSVAEALASKAGLIVSNSVTKNLDILVVADPHTQSGKAKKARSYGTRILSDAVFWKMAGIPVD